MAEQDGAMGGRTLADDGGDVMMPVWTMATRL